MKSLYLMVGGALILLLMFLGLHKVDRPAYAATGNRPNQMVIPFRNVSSSTKPSGCVNGEMRQNNLYIFHCTTTAKWRRTTKGVSF